MDPAAPLLGFIGRLDYQKGPDLVLGALPQLVAMGCQVGAVEVGEGWAGRAQLVGVGCQVGAVEGVERREGNDREGRT